MTSSAATVQPAILQAQSITIRTLIDEFSLQLDERSDLGEEWQDDLSELSDSEKTQIDQIRDGYLNQLKYPPLLEKAIQISVLGPLFFLAGFYLPPFHLRAEQSTEIVSEDEETIVRGQLDLLLVRDGFWVMAIESKRPTFSSEAGFAQLLAYVMADPDKSRPSYGLVTSGSDFLFVKLIHSAPPQCVTSSQFAMRNRGDLQMVFRIMKWIAQR